MVYNLLGQKVTHLAAGAHEAGEHTVHWDGRDSRGDEVASGVYWCRLRTGVKVETRKIVLAR